MTETTKPAELEAGFSGAAHGWGTPPPSYRIETLNDLLKVPPDRVAECLRGLECAVQFYQLAIGSGAEVGPIVFEWTDDGSNSCTLADEKGEAMLTLEVTPNA